MIRIIYYLKYYIYNIRTEEGILCTEVHKKNKNNVENIGNKKKNFSRYPFMEIHREDIWIIWIIGSYISNSIDSSEIFIKGYLEKFFFLFPIFSTLFLFFLCTSVHKIPSSV